MEANKSCAIPNRHDPELPAAQNCPLIADYSVRQLQRGEKELSKLLLPLATALGNRLMRAIVVVVVLLFILVLVGWLRLSSQDGNPSIQLETDKVKEDTATIVEKSKQAIDNATETSDQSTEPESVEPAESLEPVER